MNSRRLRHLLLVILTLAALVLLTPALSAHPAGENASYDCTQVAEIPQAECEALVAIYNATGGAQWSQAGDWLGTEMPCAWTGVTCSSSPAHVIRLVLASKGLTAPLPPEIGVLGSLTYLDLTNNPQMGNLPAEIGDLANLAALRATRAGLTALPAEIGTLSALTLLSVPQNQIGSLPAEIGNLSNLVEIQAGENQLTTLPPEIGSLTNVRQLNVTANPLTALPTQIGNMSGLQVLSASNSQLTTLPADIGNLPAIELIWIGDSALSSLPAEIGNLTTLDALYLYNNNLTTLPAEFGNLAALTELRLEDNLLTALPPEFGDLSGLQELNLANNALTALPAEFGNLDSLRILNLDNNQMAALPLTFGNLPALATLKANDNQLATLPDEFANLPLLRTLEIEGNGLAALPAAFGTLPELGYLRASHNALSSLPAGFGNLVKLSELELNSNRLTSLPAEIGNLADLDELHVENNRLTTLPPEISGLTDLNVLYAGHNEIDSLPATIGAMPNEFDVLHLDWNALTTLPPELGNLDLLKELRLSGNPLSGQIPDFMTNLPISEAFFYHFTEWCVAPDAVNVVNWLDDIPAVYGTGLDCSGAAPGAIGGQVTDENGAPLADVPVTVYRDLGDFHPLQTTTTDATGAYLFEGLNEGIEYFVYFHNPDDELVPIYYQDATTTGTATPITVSAGQTTTGIDGMLRPAVPPQVEVETPASSMHVPWDGTVQIAMPAGERSDIRFTTAAGCGPELDVLPELVELLMDLGDETKTYTMTHTAAQQFAVTVPAAAISGDATFSIRTTCPPEETGGSPTTSVTSVGSVTLYDPSGIISDADSGLPVVGATVRLYRVPNWLPKTAPDDDRPNTCQSHQSKTTNDPWSQPAPVGEGVYVNTDVTTVAPLIPWQYTDNVGHYGWDVPEGCWYVTVAAEGYEPLVSPVVGVPAPVFDLDLALTPLEGHQEEWTLYLPSLAR